MPVVNGPFGAWYEAKMCYPVGARWSSPPSIGGDLWSDPVSVAVSSLKIKQGVDITPVTDVAYGTADAHLWDIGETMWEIEATILLATPLNTIAIPSEPMFANLPNGGTVPGIWTSTQSVLSNAFISRCLTLLLASPGSLMTNHWSAYEDFMVKKVQIDITENSAEMKVNIVCTTDPREKFYLTGSSATSEAAWRLIKPYDLWIPTASNAPTTAVNYIGGPLRFEQLAITDIPDRFEYPTNDDWITGPGDGHVSYVREWHLTVEGKIKTFTSVGQPTSRPFLALEQVTCDGSISYIPLKRTASGAETFDGKMPSGWMVDTQSLDGIARHGGRFYITGSPEYSHPKAALYTGIWQRTGDWGTSRIAIVDGTIPDTPLGPILVASYDLTSSGEANAINVEYKTNVGYDNVKYPIV